MADGENCNWQSLCTPRGDDFIFSAFGAGNEVNGLAAVSATESAARILD